MRSSLISALAVAILSLAGCEKPEEIRVYTVAKPPPMEHRASDAARSSGEERDERIPDREFAQGTPAGAASAGQPTEMLGAIMPRGKMTWFFKLTGPVAAVAEVKEPFVLFIKSVRFTDKGPEWELPEGWKAEPGSQMRFATIRIASAEGPLEMSVIPLPTGEGDIGAQVLANVNRWRGQVGLGPMTDAQLAKSNEVIKSELNGEPVWFTDFVGKSQGDSMGGPVTGQAPSQRAAPGTRSQSKLPFDCQVPEGWTAGKVGQFQLAVFDVSDGPRQASVTVSTAGGDRTANINRWRGQVELGPLSADEIEQQGKKVTIDGHEGFYVEAVGPESAKSREAILGVIVEASGKQWFIKLKGDAELAAREKDRFEQFVKSIRFR